MLGDLRDRIFGTRQTVIDERVSKVVNFVEKDDHHKFTTTEKFEIITRSMEMFVERKIKRMDEIKREENSILDGIKKINKIKWKTKK